MKQSFKQLSPVVRSGPLAASWVQLSPETEFQSALIVSVPRTCGNAVQRNRFRRIGRGYFLKLSKRDGWKLPEKALWIRVNRRFRFDRKMQSRDWDFQFKKIYDELTA